MVPFQRFANGDCQNGREDNCNHSVEGGGGQLGDDGCQRGSGGQALQQQAIVEIACRQIQHSVGQGAGNDKMSAEAAISTVLSSYYNKESGYCSRD